MYVYMYFSSNTHVVLNLLVRKPTKTVNVGTKIDPVAVLAVGVRPLSKSISWEIYNGVCEDVCLLLA